MTRQSSSPPGPSLPRPAGAVYIVDDDEGMRKSLRWLVDTLGVPIFTFESAEAFLAAYESEQPGCLLLDNRMPGMTGRDLQVELRKRKMFLPIIVMTAYAGVPIAVEMMRDGAFDFLEKPLNDDVLLTRIREALELDQQSRKSRLSAQAVCDLATRLTPRETEIMKLVVEGLSSKLIAAKLHVSFKTVEAHRAKIMRKMECEGVAQLVRRVIESGLLDTLP